MDPIGIICTLSRILISRALPDHDFLLVLLYVIMDTYRSNFTLSVGNSGKSSGGLVMTYLLEDGRWGVEVVSRKRYSPIHRIP